MNKNTFLETNKLVKGKYQNGFSYDFEFVEDIFFVGLTDKSYARDLITDDF